MMDALFVIDPLDSLNLETETSLLLMEELARRGHRAWICGIGDLYLMDDGAAVHARKIELDLTRRPFYRLSAGEDHSFADFDIVLMRKDPPVDAEYIAATFVLERALADVPVINHPVSLRTVNEKLLTLKFPELVPPTLVSRDARRMRAFAATHRRIILKPLDDCSGRGIRVLGEADGDAIEAYVRAQNGRFVMAQKFLEGVSAGDKRIYVLAGEAIGAVNRVPRSPEQLANIHQGARVEATTLSARERSIVAAVKPLLLAHGLWMAGLDVIDGHLTEINVTSPSAVRQINAVSGARLEIAIVDFLESVAAGKSVAPTAALRERAELSHAEPSA